MYGKLTALLMLVLLSACGNANVRPMAVMPEVFETVEVRYVPIDAALTSPIKDPGRAMGPGSTVGDAVRSNRARGAALEGTCNGRLAQIATVQGQPVPGQPGRPLPGGAVAMGQPAPPGALGASGRVGALPVAFGWGLGVYRGPVGSVGPEIRTLGPTPADRASDRLSAVGVVRGAPALAVAPLAAR